MSNSTKYYDLHTSGAGFVNRFREVKPKAGSGNKFKPFCSVSIGAFRGSEDNVEYTNFDTVISGKDALAIMKQYKEQINDQNSKVICGFTIGDIYGYAYTTKNKKSGDDENRCGIKGRLLFLQFLKIDGEMVYKYEKPQTDDDKTEAQPQNESDKSATESSKDAVTETKVEEPQAPEASDCPFDEQLGDTVTLDTNDPAFNKKMEWLGTNGYIFNHRDNSWELNQK